MKFATVAAAFTLAALAAGSSDAGTVSGSIPMSAQIVPGVTVSAFVRGGTAVTVVRPQAGGSQVVALPYGAPPLQIGLQIHPGEVLTQRSTWDGTSQLLTIDL